MPTDPVLLTGGSGFVGGALLERLTSEGREVHALVRGDGAADAATSRGAVAVRGDVLDPPSLAAAIEGCAGVFHVAGVNAMCRRDPSLMFRTNVEGPANVIRASAAAGVRRVVVTSSAAAIGEARGTVGREDSPHRGSYLSGYERSKHLGERAALVLGSELGVEVVTVNPASVQGPGRVEGTARLLLELVKGRLPALVDTTISLVDVADCTEGHLLAEARGAPGERYLLSGVTCTTREAVDLVRRLWGRPERVRWIPPAVARAGGLGSEVLGRLARRELPVCRAAVRTLLHGHRYDGSRAERDLGLRYTPLASTVERALSWYADRGLVPGPAERAGDRPP